MAGSGRLPSHENVAPKPSSLGSITRDPSLRPDLSSRRPARAGAVNDGRRPPAKPAHSVADGSKCDGTIRPVGDAAKRKLLTLPLLRNGSLPLPPASAGAEGFVANLPFKCHRPTR